MDIYSSRRYSSWLTFGNGSGFSFKATSRTTEINSWATSRYNAANELMTLIPATGAPTTYAKDANGNLTLEQTGSAISTYTWDFENRLTGVSTSPGVETYTYTADSERMRKASPIQNNDYQWDGENLLNVYPPNFNPVPEYEIYANRFIWVPNDCSRFVGAYINLGTYFVPDPAGNIRGIGDAGLYYPYKAFGESIGPDSLDVTNTFFYGGEFGYQFDATNRLYVRARHLRNGLGRWMSRECDTRSHG